MTNATSTPTTITRTEICGSDLVDYAAWEPYGGHSTIRTNDANERLGRIGCRRLSTELEALESGSQERLDRVHAWHAAQYAEAYAAIRAEYSLPADAVEAMGEISVRV